MIPGLSSRSVLFVSVITLIAGLLMFAKTAKVTDPTPAASPLSLQTQDAISPISQAPEQPPSAPEQPLSAPVTRTSSPSDLVPTKLFNADRSPELQKAQEQAQAKIAVFFASEANARQALQTLSDCVQRGENIESIKKMFPNLQHAPPNQDFKQNLHVSCVGLGVELVQKFPDLSEQFETQVLSHVAPEIRKVAVSPALKQLVELGRQPTAPPKK